MVGIVNLSVPYHTQHNNSFYPHRTCNVTCVAMVLDFYGVKGTGKYPQLEDEIFDWMATLGYNNESHNDLAIAAEHFGKAYKVRDNFSSESTIEDCQRTLRSGHPVITAGYFTARGHVIVLTGFDEETGFFVNDPWGEWFENGYDTSASGKQLHYSYEMIERLCVRGGFMWAHHFSRLQ